MKKTKMLKKNYEFKKVLSKGKYYSGKNIEAFVLKNNKECNYLGLAISSKIAKANKRNKIKRLLRENYNKIEKKINKGNTIVFLCKKNINIENINFYSVKEDIIQILDRAKIVKEEEI